MPLAPRGHQPQVSPLFAHLETRCFTRGNIARDQVEDAGRKGMTVTTSPAPRGEDSDHRQ